MRTRTLRRLNVLVDGMLSGWVEVGFVAGVLVSVVVEAMKGGRSASNVSTGQADWAHQAKDRARSDDMTTSGGRLRTRYC
jgi:hypothetical protein